MARLRINLPVSGMELLRLRPRVPKERGGLTFDTNDDRFEIKKRYISISKIAIL